MGSAGGASGSGSGVEALPLGEFLSLSGAFRLFTGGGAVGCERRGGGVKRLVGGLLMRPKGGVTLESSDDDCERI